MSLAPNLIWVKVLENYNQGHCILSRVEFFRSLSKIPLATIIKHHIVLDYRNPPYVVPETKKFKNKILSILAVFILILIIFNLTKNSNLVPFSNFHSCENSQNTILNVFL